MSGLVLSLFPGIDLLGMAFEEEGFTVVRGPDLIWGGDIKRFAPPPGRFDGVIGGPPCQGHSTYAALNRARGNKVAECLIHEYIRCVALAKPTWWVMENVPRAPQATVPGYITTELMLDARWLGQVQSRKRLWQFGTGTGAKLDVGQDLAVLEPTHFEHACLASEGRAGKMGNKRVRATGQQRTTYHPRRAFPKFCELQGLPATFLAEAPWTLDGKYRAVGNGVPLPMGRAIARAVKAAMKHGGTH